MYLFVPQVTCATGKKENDKCVFNKQWLAKYGTWLQQESNNKHVAKYMLHSKTFGVSNMGEAAIQIHALGVKHREHTSTSDSLGIGHFFTSGREAKTLTMTSDAGLSKTTGSSTSQFIRRTDCLKSKNIMEVQSSEICS